MKSIEYRKGDATVPAGTGNKIIVHICNDIGGWGKGFVVAISKKWEAPERQYREWYHSKEEFGLGKVQFIQVEKDLWVANMIAQHKTRWENGHPPVRYDAVEECLTQVVEFCTANSCSVHMPRIGCGLAGGKWEEIEPIVDRQLLQKGVSVTVYDFD